MSDVECTEHIGTSFWPVLIVALVHYRLRQQVCGLPWPTVFLQVSTTSCRVSPLWTDDLVDCIFSNMSWKLSSLMVPHLLLSSLGASVLSRTPPAWWFTVSQCLLKITFSLKVYFLEFTHRTTVTQCWTLCCVLRRAGPKCSRRQREQPR